MKIWVLVADGHRARFFETDKPRGALKEFDDALEPRAVLPENRLDRDEPGQSFDRKGQGRHVVEPKTDPKKAVKDAFARELAERLEKAHATGRFDKLVLVCPPPFLGLLRAHLSETVKRVVSLEVDKDLTTLNAQDLRAHLPDKLAPAVEPAQ
ncbi:MAG: host attachment protein [Gammaproteobacteria bacterium]|nr:MAG: host attachment protein [Gammaproteobacteria bacterium]